MKDGIAHHVTTPIQHVLVTGSNGFVGKHLCQALSERGIAFSGSVRQHQLASQLGANYFFVPDIDDKTDWLKHAQTSRRPSFDTVFHLAAYVHQIHAGPLDEQKYFTINLEGTKRLLSFAQELGVKRFIYVSSVKAHGERSPRLNGIPMPLSAEEPGSPEDAYGRSKLLTEAYVLDFCARHAIDAVVIRPPLVYGEGVGANFLKLVRLVQRGLPLPLGLVHNRRSVVYVKNLVEALLFVAQPPADVASSVYGRVFYAADAEPLSVPELIASIAKALGRSPILLPVPVCVLRALGTLVKKQEVIQRLTEDLWVDTKPLYALGYRPRFTTDEGVARTVAGG